MIIVTQAGQNDPAGDEMISSWQQLSRLLQVRGIEACFSLLQSQQAFFCSIEMGGCSPGLLGSAGFLGCRPALPAARWAGAGDLPAATLLHRCRCGRSCR
ncbi:hypothetical protein ACVXG9_22365 [Escherichia coli]